MTSMLWFNEDGLNPAHPMLQDYADSPKVYVFDLAYLRDWNISKQRVQFIYESLLEIPDIQIYKGETVSVLRELLAQFEAQTVVTTETPNHVIKSWQHQLQDYAELITYPEVFPAQVEAVPLRFSRYWRQHDRDWLTAEPPEASV